MKVKILSICENK